MSAVAFVAGLVLITAGVALVSLPAALITAGVATAGTAVRYERGGG